jgi:nicotinamide-nucleotide amidase
MYSIEHLDSIAKTLRQNNQTIAVAESVTSGHLQAAFSLASGATDFFQGGITVYNLEMKKRHLNVDDQHARSCNCVSDQVAVEMALNAVKMFSSDWAISVTGYAAPVPEIGINELFAYYAIALMNKIVMTKRIVAPKGIIQEAQQFYVNTILRDFSEHLAIHTPKRSMINL